MGNSMNSIYTPDITYMHAYISLHGMSALIYITRVIVL